MTLEKFILYFKQITFLQEMNEYSSIATTWTFSI